MFKFTPFIRTPVIGAALISDLFYATTRAGARDEASRQGKKTLLASQCEGGKGEVHRSPAVEAEEVAPTSSGKVPRSAYEEGPRKFAPMSSGSSLLWVGLEVGRTGAGGKGVFLGVAG